MPRKKSNKQKFFIFLIIILLFATLWIYIAPANFHNPTTTSSTTSTTSTTISVTTTFPAAKSLTREVFLDEKSGEGLIWFSNSTVSDVRTGMKIWEEKTNRLIKFEEIRGESAADLVIKFSGYMNESTPGFKTVGEAYTYLGQMRGTIYILPSSLSCRNQGRAMHEIGHIIGLNHSTDYRSVMHPIESCVQNITDEDARTAINLIDQFI
jgi:hypothetical protein